MTLHSQGKTGRGQENASVQALFDEIDAEVKAERFEKFIKRYGLYIAAAVLLAVVATGAVNVWQNWTIQQRQKETAMLIALMDSDPAALDDTALKAVLKSLITLGKSGHGEGIRLAARSAEISILLRKGQKEAAVERLDAMRKDESLRPLYRDYAALQHVRARLDDAKPEDLAAEIASLLADDNPWRLSALQTAALIDAKMGKRDAAIAKLQRIVDAVDAPLAGREEAQRLLRLYKAM